MIVEFPIFGAGIIYFPTELSALRVFEPRYLLLIADAIKQRKTFCVSNNLGEESQVISEVEIIEHRDISNAEQLVLVKCVNLYKTKSIKTDKEYPICNAEIIIDGKNINTFGVSAIHKSLLGKDSKDWKITDDYLEKWEERLMETLDIYQRLIK